MVVCAVKKMTQVKNFVDFASQAGYYISMQNICVQSLVRQAQTQNNTAFSMCVSC
jgi:hypothetical protein